MSYKLLMQWDIKPGRDQDYFEFMVRDWVPGIQRLGVQPIASWYTVYSHDDAPQIIAEALTDNLDTMREVLEGEGWKELHLRLLDYVENYSHKVVRTTGGFQI